MKEYFENDEENAPMSDLYHLYYMKKEKCADITRDIKNKQNDAEDQEQPYLIERFDSYCKKCCNLRLCNIRAIHPLLQQRPYPDENKTDSA